MAVWSLSELVLVYCIAKRCICARIGRIELGLRVCRWLLHQMALAPNAIGLADGSWASSVLCACDMGKGVSA